MIFFLANAFNWLKMISIFPDIYAHSCLCCHQRNVLLFTICKSLTTNHSIRVLVWFSTPFVIVLVSFFPSLFFLVFVLCVCFVLFFCFSNLKKKANFETNFDNLQMFFTFVFDFFWVKFRLNSFQFEVRWQRRKCWMKIPFHDISFGFVYFSSLIILTLSFDHICF